MKIVAFGASYSRDSINKEWARFVAFQISKESSEVLDLKLKNISRGITAINYNNYLSL